MGEDCVRCGGIVDWSEFCPMPSGYYPPAGLCHSCVVELLSDSKTRVMNWKGGSFMNWITGEVIGERGGFVPWEGSVG